MIPKFDARFHNYENTRAQLETDTLLHAHKVVFFISQECTKAFWRQVVFYHSLRLWMVKSETSLERHWTWWPPLLARYAHPDIVKVSKQLVGGAMENKGAYHRAVIHAAESFQGRVLPMTTTMMTTRTAVWRINDLPFSRAAQKQHYSVFSWAPDFRKKSAWWRNTSKTATREREHTSLHVHCKQTNAMLLAHIDLQYQD